jgi:hypothetical protein
MEDLEGVDIFRQGCFLVDDTFKFLILLLDGNHAILVPSHELFGLQFNSFCESCDLLVLDDDAFVEVGPEFVLALVELLSDLVDLVPEEQELELVVVDDGGLGLLELEDAFVETLDLLLQLLVGLHHRLDLHLRLQLHPLDRHLQLRLALLPLPDPLLVRLPLPLELEQLLLQLDLSVAALVRKHRLVLTHQLVRERHLLFLSLPQQCLLVCL